MNTRVTLNCQVKPDGHEALLPFLEKNLPNVRGFDGCISVNVYFDEEGGEMLLEEEWLCIEQHKAYINHIENNGVLGELAAFLAFAPDIKYFQNQGI